LLLCRFFPPADVNIATCNFVSQKQTQYLIPVSDHKVKLCI
jgi:hypothetical protein